jgi:dTDP-4-amino-4,6-dideoxygalactose transaminase
LQALPGWLERRARNAMLLTQALRGAPGLIVPEPPADVRHAWYKYYVQLRDPVDEPVEDYRARIIRKLAEDGIPVATGSCPDMSQEGALAGKAIRMDGTLDEARNLGRRSLMFPVDHTLGDAEMERIAGALLKALA